MSTKTEVFREYVSDLSFINLVIPENVKKFQVVLVLAMDDGNGNFIAKWDPNLVTPEVIECFKKKHKGVEVLVSIGNKFTIASGTDLWIRHAIASLTYIITTYHLDGVDVNYEDIQTTQDNFVQCIGGVVKNLMDSKVITVASMAPNGTTSDKFYLPLYKQFSSYFDTVVFQIFIGLNPSSIEDLKEKILAVAEQYKPVKNYLVGYSALREDWTNISPPVFFITLYDLLHNPEVQGASIKVIRDSYASFPATWITELLRLLALHA